MRYKVKKDIMYAVKKVNRDLLDASDSQALPLCAYEKATEIVKKEIQAKCQGWLDQIAAFQIYYEELQHMEKTLGITLA